MQFHALQHDVIQGDVQGTQLTIESQLTSANLDNGEYVVLQEMTVSGWSMDIHAVSDIGSVEWALGLATQYGVWLQVGWAKRKGDRGLNCVTICSPDGNIVATYEKLYTCNPFQENSTYDCGQELVIIEINGTRICPLICYDLRFPELWRLAALAGVDVFTVSSSWPLLRIDHWTSLLIARAIENQAYVVGANRIGSDAIATWGGHSMILSAKGEILAQCGDAEVATISSELDVVSSSSWREEFPVLDDIKAELLGSINVQQITAC